MSVPTQLETMIQKRLAEFLAGTDPERSDLQRLATHLQALPLYVDMGACIAIRPDGELISIHTNQDWSKPDEWTSEIEPKWRTVALAVGSQKYPELKALLPMRGPRDLDCPDCSGTGRVVSGYVCNACLGVGWRPRV